jgi:2-polyprenyl-3-methyl-5-hydroxy-6-metoxy-1,4-benzoquinol methylase
MLNIKEKNMGQNFLQMPKFLKNFPKKLNPIDYSLPFLTCPNCSESIINNKKTLHCSSCSSDFQILDENIIDLVSHNSFDFKTNASSESYSEYSDLRNLGHPTEEKARLWGLESKFGISGFVFTLRNKIISLLEDEIICDIGAGVGNYSLFFANQAKFVFHCDLDLEAILSAAKEAKKQKINNILFIRCDYLYLPFRSNSLDCITSIDVLEKGYEHDSKLIEQISQKLISNGKYIIDFHTKERTKLTKAPITDRYSKEELTALINSHDLSITKIFGMGYLPTIRNFSRFFYSIGNVFCKLFFPPARWLVVGKKN